MNSPLKDRIVNDNYRYIDWSAGGPNPKVLDEHDFEPIEKSRMLFARKFEVLKSATLMNLIDTKLLILYSVLTWPLSSI
jgi:hypothetical protein